MASSKLNLLLALVFCSTLVMMVLGVIGIVGALDLTNGCLYRYSFDNNGTISMSDEITDSIILKANGNYTAISSDSSGEVSFDPNSYGNWVNTNLYVSGNQRVKYSIQGEMNLCKSYLPENNLQSSSNKDINGDVIVIPSTDDKVTPAVTLYIDAKTNEWRNLAEIYPNDHVVVSILPDQKTTSPSVSVYNSIKQGLINADCREGSRSYDPICGRYTIWNSSTSYTDTCNFIEKCYECNCSKQCAGLSPGNNCYGKWVTVCDWCSCYQAIPGTAPEPYENDGKYTSPWRDNLSDLITNFDRSCESEKNYITGDYQDEKYFWFSADDATGLLYKLKDNSSISSDIGSNYEIAEIDSDQSFYTEGENYKIILNTVNGDSGIKYLQYRLYDNDDGENTGGYVLNIKHSKCRRSNGNAFTDTVDARGLVEYVIAGYGNNPNTNTPTDVGPMLADASGAGEFTASSEAEGYLWLKVKNDEADYKESSGQYTVEFFTSVPRGEFYKDALKPFFENLRSKISGVSETIFKNITCYKGLGDPVGECINFFQYIKAMLILYIMLYGMMFLMGMVKISQTDLVIRVIKVGIVAGLMSGETFEFFNTYIFDLVVNFSDEIISNMSGYSAFSELDGKAGPFMFLDAVLTKIFMSSTFMGQIVALLSMGLNGVLYFIIICICICIVVIVSFRAMAIYVMAFMAISVLIAIAPLFLSFVLFERTWYLFDNWLKFMFRYMLEPVIVLAGIIILTQLFTIYLDYVVGYSVCWTCSLAFKIPFPQVEGITPAFLDVPLFCLYFFAPWGFDGSSGELGMNMQNMVVLLIIAYCMWGYLDFANKIVARLAGGSGGPSATSMGGKMSGNIENNALKKVGLDAESRKNIAKGMSQMASSMRSGTKLNPDEANNRFDKSGGPSKPSSAGSGAGSDARRGSISSGVLPSQQATESGSQAKNSASAGSASSSAGSVSAAQKSSGKNNKGTWKSAMALGTEAYNKMFGDGGNSQADSETSSGSGRSSSSVRQKLQNAAQMLTGSSRKTDESNNKDDNQASDNNNPTDNRSETNDPKSVSTSNNDPKSVSTSDNDTTSRTNSTISNDVDQRINDKGDQTQEDINQKDKEEKGDDAVTPDAKSDVSDSKQNSSLGNVDSTQDSKKKNAPKKDNNQSKKPEGSESSSGENPDKRKVSRSDGSGFKDLIEEDQDRKKEDKDDQDE